MAKGNESAVSSNNISFIGAGTVIEGNIKCGSDLRIDGKVEGKVIVKGKVVIGDAGRVEGEVTCANADISGQLDGKIQVSELLSLKSRSQLKGEIITKRLSIEPGSIFNGTCTMGETSTETPAKGQKGA